MKIEEIKEKIPLELYEVLKKSNIKELRPAQEKAISKGLLNDENLLICTPTASGKTLIAELAMLNKLLTKQKSKSIYLAPLKALASEKYNDFKNKYSHLIEVAIATGDLDSNDSYLETKDLIITTPEKLDSLLRHRADWISQVKVLVIDEIHLLNDAERGPVLEVIISLLRYVVKDIQIIALSATIGNPEELSSWLNSQLIIDNWRPVKLLQGIILDHEIEFYDS